MKDPVIESKTNELISLVNQINVIMSDLQDMNVEVRISYIEKGDNKYPAENSIKQGISLWRVEEHNGYL